MVDRGLIDHDSIVDNDDDKDDDHHHHNHDDVVRYECNIFVWNSFNAIDI